MDATGGLSHLAEADRRALLTIEETLRHGTEGQAEDVFRRCLPDLLYHGGAPYVEGLLAQAAPGPVRDSLLRAMELAWPKVDPAAAIAWAGRLPDESARREAYERVLFSLAGIDPAKAVQTAATLDETRENGATLTRELVAMWAAADFQAARRWTLSLPPGEQHDACVARVATVAARSFPAEAARFALKRLPPGPVLDETLITTLYYWTERNADEARRWVDSFPDGPLRERALQEVNGSANSSPDSDGQTSTTP